MRISAVQNSCDFRMLQVKSDRHLFNESQIKTCEKQLAKTKFIDVVLDSYGLALKDKMTEVLYRIQSFSLFPKDNAVGIRMQGEEEPVFKFTYNSITDAKDAWLKLQGYEDYTFLEKYTKVALWLEKKLDDKKNKVFCKDIFNK